VFGTKVEKTDGSTTEGRRMNTLRNIGKEAILALGYGMGVEKFLGTLKSKSDAVPLFADGTLSTAVCAGIVHSYRRRYPKIKNFWQECEKAFVYASGGQAVSLNGLLYFYSNDGAVHIRLPSGRPLVYTKVEVRQERKKVIYIDGKGGRQESEFGGYDITWGRKKTKLYGGKIVENIIQGIARDILVDTMKRFEGNNWKVLFHIHDEICCQVPVNRSAACLDALIFEWRKGPEWMDGLKLDAEGYEGESLLEIA